MRRIILSSTAILTVLVLTACGEPSPKVGEPPATTTSGPAVDETPITQAPAVDEDEQADAIVEEPEPQDDFQTGETMLSLNEAYQMTAIGDWSIVRAEPNQPGYPEGEVHDPVELWVITHPEVEMEGEISLGTNFTPTAPRPVFVVESMTEEALPELSSQYGNAYLVEGLIEVGGETMYRASIVTDHRQDKEISESLEYFGDRTPAPRFMFLMHSLDPAAFEEYRQSQARQDLLQMLRTLQIEDPPYSEEGVEMDSHEGWVEGY